MDLVLDPVTGDLDVADYISPRLFTAGEDILAVRQRVTIRLRTFLGEWFLDQRVGVPWFQSIIGHKNAPALAAALLREVVRSTPGVVSVDEVTVATDGRDTTFTIKAKSSAGPLDLAEVRLLTTALSP